MTGKERGATTPSAVAGRWIHHFNAHDVASLVALYAEDGRHTSPRIRALYPETNGVLVGRSALAEWWKAALRQTPGLQYEVSWVVGNDAIAVVEYIRHAPGETDMTVVERFEVEHGQIVSSRVFL